MQSIRARGFTLVELMVTVTIMVILVIIALPDVSGWLQNAKTRSVAESVQNGLRYAQAQAASLSRVTLFVLPTTTSWAVYFVPVTGDSDNYPGLAPPPDPSSQLQASPAGALEGTLIGPDASAPVIAFDSLGRVSFAASVSAALAGTSALTNNATITVTNPNGTRTLDIVVSPAGKVRMCDQAKTFSPTTPDGC